MSDPHGTVPVTPPRTLPVVPLLRRALGPLLAVALPYLAVTPAFAQQQTDPAAAADTGVIAAAPADDAPGAPSPPAAAAYPTTAIADYVLGCMAANGNSYIALQQCSCSIDYIAARMPWADYEQAGTVMQVQLDRGQRGLFYRDSSWAKQRVQQLENLQAQSTLECF